LADRQFVVGETYPMEVHEDRSRQSHQHYFAAIEDCWQNLPEAVAEEFPTSEHLRKYALIKAGYCERRSIVCPSPAEAERVAAFVKPIDEFALVEITGPVVTVYTAKSQSLRAMGKADFQKSKQAVLDILSAMVGVEASELKANTGRAA